LRTLTHEQQKRHFEGFGKALVFVGELEAAIGFEPMHRGFADLSLTTWVRRPAESLRSAIIYHARADASIEAE
jgi:hypothetical protein